MVLRHGVAIASSVALAIGLTACGVGGGGGVDSIPPPPPSPPPPPPPPSAPTPPPAPPGSIGLTHEGGFSTYGIGYRFTTDTAGNNLQGPAAPDSAETVEFTYLPGEKVYEVRVPGFNRGRLETLSYGGSANENGWLRVDGSYNAVTDGSSSARQDLFVSLVWPGNNTDLNLTYTSLGSWDGRTAGTTSSERRNYVGDFAYGLPTAAGDMPRSGTARYEAVVRGRTAVTGTRPPDFIGGTARLVFDFGTGSLTGSMRPIFWDWDPYELGVYEFTQTVYSPGSTLFSGKFAVPGSTADSFFEGRFTGPQAAELMGRWQAPFLNPVNKQWSTMFGVWAGKKQ